MQTAAIRTVAYSLPQNEVILLTILISRRYIPYTDLRKFSAKTDPRQVRFGKHPIPDAPSGYPPSIKKTVEGSLPGVDSAVNTHTTAPNRTGQRITFSKHESRRRARHGNPHRGSARNRCRSRPPSAERNRGGHPSPLPQQVPHGRLRPARSPAANPRQ